MIAFTAFFVVALGSIWFWARGAERRIVAFGLLLRLALLPIVIQLSIPVSGTRSITPSAESDDVSYYRTAASIYDAQSFDGAADEFAILVNPGFFYLLGAFFLVFGKLWFIPHALNLLAGIALPVAVVRLARVLGVDRAGAERAGWITAVLPTLAFFSLTGYKDMFTIFVATMSIYSIARLYRSGWSSGGALQVLFWTGCTMVFRLGLVPLVGAAFGLVAMRRLRARGVLLLILVAGVSFPPAFSWWQAAALTDYFSLMEILSQSGTESGMAAQVLQGGVATWPLRALVFLLLPYPSLTELGSAWDLYTWLNLSWYLALAMAIPGACLLWSRARERGSELGLLPLAFVAVVLFSLMIRGMPNMRYILSIAPLVAIMASTALGRRDTAMAGITLIVVGASAAIPGYFLLRISL